MNEDQFNARLGWLGSILSAQRNNLAEVLLRLKAFGLRAGTSLALHKKFEHFLSQVAHEREKELEIIHEIETVEKRHQEMKQRKLLRSANTENTPLNNVTAPLIQEEEKPKRGGLLGLFTFLCLFSPSRIKHKNQDLTVD